MLCVRARARMKTFAHSWILIESEIRNSGFNDRVVQMNWTHSLTQISFYLLTSCT